MARDRRDQPLLPTLLDRLLDDGVTYQPYSMQLVSDLKESVRRDLENLLNTRHRPTSWPSEYAELNQSTVNYGLPDFAGTNASDAREVKRFVGIIQNLIRTFEPRFKSVQVKVVENAQAEDRVLRFRIEGTLHAEPVPEPAVFETDLEPAIGSFEVKSR